MTANIFISFASKDVKMAMTLCTALENRGYKCWISARDIQPGENFQVAIVQAIRHAKIMLLVFTGNSNNSEEMTKELALASQQKMIVIPLRVEDVTPSDAFAYEFATRQWIDFFADWEFAIEQLARRIANALRERSAGLETNDVAEALTEVAATAPVAYTIEPPEKSKAEARPAAAKDAASAASKPVEPAKAPEPLAAAPAAKAPPAPEPIGEVRKQVLAEVAPSAAAKAPTPPAKPAPARPSEPSKPELAKARLGLEPVQEEARRGMSGRTLALVAGIVVVVLTGIGLTVPKMLQQKPAPAPVEAAAPPPAPTVVQVSTPAPVVPEPALAVNAPAAGAAATNALATNAVRTAPRKKAAAPAAQTQPKDDIPF
jgi:hypothetical protein